MTRNFFPISQTYSHSIRCGFPCLPWVPEFFPEIALWRWQWTRRRTDLETAVRFQFQFSSSYGWDFVARMVDRRAVEFQMKSSIVRCEKCTQALNILCWGVGLRQHYGIARLLRLSPFDRRFLAPNEFRLSLRSRSLDLSVSTTMLWPPNPTVVVSVKMNQTTTTIF